MNEQEIRKRYPEADIRRGQRDDGWIIHRFPLVPDRLTVPQWLALDGLTSGSFRPDGRQLRVYRKLVDYGLASLTVDGLAEITVAGRDYTNGHFEHGWIPDKRTGD